MKGSTSKNHKGVMKRNNLLIFFLLVSSLVFSQTWAIRYSSPTGQVAPSMLFISIGSAVRSGVGAAITVKITASAGETVLHSVENAGVIEK
jgi:hypothetical protein